MLIGCDVPSNSSQSDGGQDGGTSKKKGPFDGWQSDYKQMVTVLELNDEDSAALKAEFEKHVKIYDEWNEQYGDKYRKSFREIVNAAKNKNLSRIRNVSPEEKKLREQFLKIGTDQAAGVVNVLSEENRNKWRGHLISEHFFELADKMEFSDQQKQAIRQAAIDAAGVKANEPNPKAAGFAEFEKQIERSVFDQNQRSEYAKIKDKNKLRTLAF